jgi:hypothetical protein
MLNALLMAPAADLPAAQPACSAAEQVAILTSLAFKLHAIVDDGFGSACTGDSMHTCNVSGLGRRKECMRRVCSATALTLAKTGDRRASRALDPGTSVGYMAARSLRAHQLQARTSGLHRPHPADQLPRPSPTELTRPRPTLAGGRHRTQSSGGGLRISRASHCQANQTTHDAVS